MIEFRDRTAREYGPPPDLRALSTPRGIAAGVAPFSHGTAYAADLMLTTALKRARPLGFDAFGG